MNIEANPPTAIPFSVNDAIVGLLENTSDEVRSLVSGMVEEEAESLTMEFYEVMLGDPSAAQFLAHDVVSERLQRTMQEWLRHLFVGLTPARVGFLVARETEVGRVHARIKLPLSLMQAGTRTLCIGMEVRLHAREVPAELALRAEIYLCRLMYLAEGIMLNAYIQDVRKGASAQADYRHAVMTHDTLLERERQRAVLSEWASEVLFSAHSPAQLRRVPKLADSEFGMWFKHKARVLFDGAPDTEIVTEVVEQIDTVLIPKLASGELSPPEGHEVLAELRRQLELVRYLVGDLFDRLTSASSAKDAATGLLSRRHLPTVLEQTIADHAPRHLPFAVLLARVDSPRGDVIDVDSRSAFLHQIAAIFLESVRSSDHLFRYGDDEFLIIAVETDEARAKDLAEAIRKKVLSHHFKLRQNTATHVTVSIGLAVHDGHPDYLQLIRRGELACVLAAVEGGNRLAHA
ncbi:MAG: diguanylate cyclase [Zoogloeaceae bacterium]|nr:diguanylate cyclase [Zoogloeaceae bacterium]